MTGDSSYSTSKIKWLAGVVFVAILQPFAWDLYQTTKPIILNLANDNVAPILSPQQWYAIAHLIVYTFVGLFFYRRRPERPNAFKGFKAKFVESIFQVYRTLFIAIILGGIYLSFNFIDTVWFLSFLFSVMGLVFSISCLHLLNIVFQVLFREMMFAELYAERVEVDVYKNESRRDILKELELDAETLYGFRFLE